MKSFYKKVLNNTKLLILLIQVYFEKLKKLFGVKAPSSRYMYLIRLPLTNDRQRFTSIV